MCSKCIYVIGGICDSFDKSIFMTVDIKDNFLSMHNNA